MKKILCLLLAIWVIFSATGCSNSIPTSKQAATKTNYYSSIKEQDNNLVFDLELNDFVSNYRKTAFMIKYERDVEFDTTDTMLEVSDFEKIGTGTSWFTPIESERWSVLLSDNNNLVVGKDNNGIASIMLMSPSKTEILLSQFICVIQAVTQEFTDDNYIDEEAFDIADELIEKMGTATNAAAVYRKGIVFYFRPLENPDVWVFGAEAVTEEQYKKITNKE